MVTNNTASPKSTTSANAVFNLPSSTNASTATNNAITRANSGNNSFTAASLCRREISRFSTLNRSFNNVANTLAASDFCHKLQLEQVNVAEHGDRTRASRRDDYLLSVATAADNSMTKDGGNRSFIRSISQQVRQQVQCSLSDPARTRDILVKSCRVENACGICAKCHLRQSIGLTTGVGYHSRTSSLKRRAAIDQISNNLRLPKFLKGMNCAF